MQVAVGEKTLAGFLIAKHSQFIFINEVCRKQTSTRVDVYVMHNDKNRQKSGRRSKILGTGVLHPDV